MTTETRASDQMAFTNGKETEVNGGAYHFSILFSLWPRPWNGSSLIHGRSSYLKEPSVDSKYELSEKYKQFVFKIFSRNPSLNYFEHSQHLGN